MNIYHVYNRRGALCLSQGRRMGYPAWYVPGCHYRDVIMGTIASQITSLTIVYSTVYSGADQRKHQSSASLAFVWGIHRWIPRTNGRHCGKCFHLMTSSCMRHVTVSPVVFQSRLHQFLQWHSNVEQFQLSFPSGVPIYRASIRWVAHGVPVYTG